MSTNNANSKEKPENNVATEKVADNKDEEKADLVSINWYN